MRNNGIFAFGLERLGLACLRAPVTSAIVVACITIAAFIGVAQIKFDDDLRRLFRSGSSVDLSYEALLKKFPSIEDELLLLVESDRPMKADQIEALRNLHLDLQLVEGVEGVTSVFSAREPMDADGEAPTLIPDELPEGEELKTLLAKVRKDASVVGRLLSQDQSAALFLVSLTPDTQGLEASTKLLERIRETSDPLAEEGRFKVTPTGTVALRHDILQTIYNDLFILNLIGAALAIFICFIFLGNPLLVIVGALPPICAVLWTLGGFGLVGIPLTAMNNVLPTLILVIAFCDSLHMVQVIRGRLGDGMEVREAVRTAVVEVGPACAMTSLTTMVACLTLAMSKSLSVREFGFAGGASVLTAYAAVITLVPLLSLLVLRKREAGSKSGDFAIVQAFNAKLASASLAIGGFAMRNAWGIAVACIPLLLVSGFLYFKIGTSYDYRTYLSPQSQANQAIDRINVRFGGADAFFVIVTASPKSDGVPPVLGKVHEAVANTPDITGVFSAHSLKDLIGAGKIGRTGAGEADDEKAPIPQHYAKRLVAENGRDWLVSAYLPATPAPETRARLLVLDKRLDTVREANPEAKVGITGIVPLGAFSSVTMINGLKVSLAVAVMITTIMVMLAAGSLRLAALSAIPNLLPLSLVAAGLYVFGQRFEITSVLALTIAFGIAIDNTIHMLNRFRLESGEDDIEKRIINTISRVGPVLIAATLVLCFGLAVTQMSVLPVMQLFGKLTVCVLVLALLCALIALPALIRVVGRKKPA